MPSDINIAKAVTTIEIKNRTTVTTKRCGIDVNNQKKKKKDNRGTIIEMMGMVMVDVMVVDVIMLDRGGDEYGDSGQRW